MPEKNLANLKVAILVDNGFEQSEMVEPRKALEEEGAQTRLVSPQAKTVRAWDMKNWGDEFQVDLNLVKAQANEFDALVLPGGVMNPDKLRTQPKAVEFVKSFFDAKKPVAAICHGPWTIVEAGAASGRRMTSWPSLKTDLQNAGAEWVDQQAVVDDNLVSSRKPSNISAFNKNMVEMFGQKYQQRQQKVSVSRH